MVIQNAILDTHNDIVDIHNSIIDIRYQSFIYINIISMSKIAL